MNKYNDKGERHGYWEVHNSNGKLCYKENYVNGKEHGLCEYYSNGKLCYKANYINGKLYGLYEWYSTSDKLNIKQYYL